MATQITVTLPELHPKQSDFVLSEAKRKVIVAGRRGGKTTGAAFLACNGLLHGRRVLEAAPTSEQTNAFWESCKRYLQEGISTGLIRKNETGRSLDFLATGGRIRCKTAWDADTLRGDYADLLILDEYSLMRPSAWDEVGAPMLLDNNGDAVFIFTPKRRNHAYHAYQRALNSENGRWEAWHFTSHDNPYLSAIALEEITGDMTSEAYKQEILAEFLDSEGQVFRNISACSTVVAPSQPEEHTGHTIAFGVDWAKQHDYTVITIICRDCMQVVDWDRFNQIDFVVQRGRLAGLAHKWKPHVILAESNSIGEPNIEILQREGLPVVGFLTTANSKTLIIEALALALEKKMIAFPSEYAVELAAYEMKRTESTGRPRYSAPPGVHDDRVISLCLAYKAVASGPLILFEA